MGQPPDTHPRVNVQSFPVQSLPLQGETRAIKSHIPYMSHEIRQKNVISQMLPFELRDSVLYGLW